ncbi:MAG: Uma2 family endonuclease [Dehalococcoidia bacterium]
MPVQAVSRRFTVSEYYRMVEAGIISEDDRVELIQGEVIEMAPIGSRHAACVNRLSQLFHDVGTGEFIVSVQNPVHLGERSEPQPDLCVLNRRADYYAESHPGPGDVLLLVEVADSSAEYDREIKVPLYGRAGIRESWLVLLDDGVVEVYREPSPEGYREMHKFVQGEELSAGFKPDQTLQIDDFLPAN